MKTIAVSVYWMWEWWEKYYHQQIPRPTVASDDALDDMYLGRQRFLATEFGEIGLGSESPVMDGAFVNTVIRWGFDLIPYLLGASLTCCESGGWRPRPLTDAEVWSLEPVDLATHPEGDALRCAIAQKRARYGSASQCIDLGSVMNNGFRLRADQLYIDLLDDPALLRHFFDVIIETERLAYRVLHAEFPPMDPVPISNCNVTLLSPRVYEECILPYDQQQARFCAELTGGTARAAVHHCDVPVDAFIAVYAQLPLASLQASYQSDIARVKTAMPSTAFSAMVNPVDLGQERAALPARLRKALATGADELCLWNIDPSVSPADLREVFQMVRSACADAGVVPQFTAIPFCWDEIEWAFPRYQTAMSS